MEPHTPSTEPDSANAPAPSPTHSPAPPNPGDLIFDSGPSAPDDAFWLKEGQTMVSSSLKSVQEAGTAFLKGLGVLQGLYVAMLGISDFVPETLTSLERGLFALPLLAWLIATYLSLQVLMTQRMNIYLHSPDDIREKSGQALVEKQSHLQKAFVFTALGLLGVAILFILQL